MTNDSQDSRTATQRQAGIGVSERVEPGGTENVPLGTPPGTGRSAARMGKSAPSNFDDESSEAPEIAAAFAAFMAALGRKLRPRPRHLRETETEPRRRLGWLGGLVMAACLWIVVVGAILAWALRDVPWQLLMDGGLEPVVVIEDSTGERLFQEGTVRGAYAELDDFPRHLIDAVLSIEDRRFFAHRGFDLRGTLRALVRNASAGQIMEGGSTITQQLVKVLYLESERTYRRKIQEIMISFWLEARLGKEEILARYLNSIYLGAGATGVPAAARVYFDKEVGDLELWEAVVIAGLIRAPSALNPLNNSEGARRRGAVVLQAMQDNGVIGSADVAAVRLDIDELDLSRSGGQSGSWFADWVMEDAREIAGPYRGTIRFRTTLMPEIQAIAERAVGELMSEHGEEAGASQAALVALAPDGAVLAMTGGLDYRQSSFNRAVQAMRQPGSTFKLFVYYAALKAGLDPSDVVEDAPIEVAGWSPENFGGSFHGRVTLAEAFARSLNAATVQVAETVGIDKVVEAARELGIDAPLVETPSLALGTSEVSLLDLAGAYASIRAGVAPIEPWGIEMFRADDDSRAFRVGPTRPPQTDIGPLQRPMIDMLRLVVERGTGTRAALDEFVAGKTGTSQNFRDAWFVGFTEHLVVGVWVGNDDGTPMKEVTGGGLPSRIWQRFAGEAGAVLSGSGPELAAASPSAAGPDPMFVGGGGNRTVRDDPHRVVVDEELQEEASRVHACDVRACSRRYRSFRVSDCTYQPYHGPRRQCDIGRTEGSWVRADRGGGSRPTAVYGSTGRSFLVQRQADQAGSCNIQACSRHYRSFRASDCTYQPYGGPRRLCTR